MLIAYTKVQKALNAEMMNSLEILKSFFSIQEAFWPHTVPFAMPLVSLVSVCIGGYWELSWQVKVFSLQKGPAYCLVVIYSSCMTVLYFFMWQPVRIFALTEAREPSKELRWDVMRSAVSYSKRWHLQENALLSLHLFTSQGLLTSPSLKNFAQLPSEDQSLWLVLGVRWKHLPCFMWFLGCSAGLGIIPSDAWHLPSGPICHA